MSEENEKVMQEPEAEAAAEEAVKEEAKEEKAGEKAAEEPKSGEAEEAEAAEEEAVKEEAKEEKAGEKAAEEPKSSAADAGGSLYQVWKAIRAFRRDDVAKLIKEHALDIATPEQLDEIMSAIMGLRDINLIELLAKEVGKFKPDMLVMDFENWNNRDFVRRVLTKCKGCFDLNDEEVCTRLFTIACDVGQTDVLSYLINKKKVKDGYVLLAKGSEDAFHVLKQVKAKSLTPDQRVEILYAAAVEEDGVERLDKLADMGYDLEETNSDEKTLSDLMQERLATYSYAKGRIGDMNRVRDRSIVQYLERKRTEALTPKEKRKINWKRTIPFIILLVIFLAILGFAIGYQIVA